MNKQMKEYYCKSCGASVKHTYNHHCPYCGTLLDFNTDDEPLEINFEDIVDVEFMECYEDFIDNSIVLYFKGMQIEKPKMYEIDENIQVSPTIFKPKKCICAIKIEDYELNKYKDSYFKHLLYSHFSRLRNEELQKLITEIFTDKTFIKRLYKNGMYIDNNCIL